MKKYITKQRGVTFLFIGMFAVIVILIIQVNVKNQQEAENALASNNNTLSQNIISYPTYPASFAISNIEDAAKDPNFVPQTIGLNDTPTSFADYLNTPEVLASVKAYNDDQIEGALRLESAKVSWNTTPFTCSSETRGGDLKNQMVGTWTGYAFPDNGSFYEVKMTFNADGSYDAIGTRSDGYYEPTAFYYGTDDASNLKKYSVIIQSKEDSTCNVFMENRIMFDVNNTTDNYTGKLYNFEFDQTNSKAKFSFRPQWLGNLNFKVDYYITKSI